MKTIPVYTGPRSAAKDETLRTILQKVDGSVSDLLVLHDLPANGLTLAEAGKIFKDLTTGIRQFQGVAFDLNRRLEY